MYVYNYAQFTARLKAPARKKSVYLKLKHKMSLYSSCAFLHIPVVVVVVAYEYNTTYLPAYKIPQVSNNNNK